MTNQLTSARLAQHFANAIQNAMDQVAAEHGASLNSALGALVGVQAFMIAGVENERHRKALIEQVEK